MTLKYPEIPAEDVLFREQFVNNSYVGDNGGTLINNPTIDNGVTLNGTDQYLTYSFSGLVGKDSVTMEVFFTPTFDYDEDAPSFILDSTSGAKYWILKHSNAASNVINIRVGNVGINIPSADYSAYWKQNELNHIAVCGTSGATDAYLNGQKILDADATAWTPKDPTTLYIGSSEGASSLFSGVIHEVNIYGRKFTEGEVLDSQQRITFKEPTPEQSEIWLPLRTYYNDGSNEITPNLGNVADDQCYWGTGSGTETPTLLQNNGIGLDGSDDHLEIQQSAQFNSVFEKDQKQGYFFLFRHEAGLASVYVVVSKSEGIGGDYKGVSTYFSNGMLYYRMYDDGTGSGIKARTNTQWNDGLWHSAAVSYDGNETEAGISFYIDGEKQAQTNTGNSGFTGSVVTTEPMWIGEASYGGLNFPGDLKFPMVFNNELTPTQVKWLHDKAFRELNL